MTGWKLALGATVPAREDAVRVEIIGRMVVRNQCIFEMANYDQSKKWVVEEKVKLNERL